MTDNFTIPERDEAIFNLILKKPQEFLEGKDQTINQLKERVKECYDYTKSQEIVKTAKSDALPELILKNFDLEQIFQQIELQNEPLLAKSLTNVTRFVVGKDRLVFKNLEQTLSEIEANNPSRDVTNEDAAMESDQEHMEADRDDNESIENEEEVELDDRKSDDDNSNEENIRNDPGPSRSYRKSIVDDDFFKLDEMEAFLNAEERRTDEPDSGNDSEENESDGSEESVDLFEPSQQNQDFEDDETIKARYKDFFIAQDERNKPEKRNKFLEEFDANNEDEDQEEPKSSFELRQERLADKIEELEENATGEKPWQLKGEITAEGRPQNSLLEEIVEFDMTSRPAPVITEQTTMQLEDIIRQRIKNKVFDSVERKAKPVETALEYKKKLVLNQEKSKESLAQIYEKEYLEQKDVQDGVEKPDVEPELHKEINSMMSELFHKLDSLSNFHFTPKPAAPELKIVSNLPAINMEEVAPIATSDATLLAPEEVKGKTKGGEIVGESERTSTDKKRQRRRKKLKQKAHVQEKEKREIAKAKAGVSGNNNKLGKQKAKKMLDKVVKDRNVDKIDESSGSKSVKSSTAFFTQLQEQVRTQIKQKGAVQKKGKAQNRLDAKKMKL